MNWRGLEWYSEKTATGYTLHCCIRIDSLVFARTAHIRDISPDEAAIFLPNVIEVLREHVRGDVYCWLGFDDDDNSTDAVRRRLAVRWYPNSIAGGEQ